MKKLWKLGAVLAVLTLLFSTGCKEEAAKKPPKPTITGITLQISPSANLSGTPVDVKPRGLVYDEARIFSAVVTGTGKFNSGYTLSVTAHGGIIADLIDNEAATGDARKITAKSVTGVIRIQATSKGNAAIKSDVWEMAITENALSTTNYMTGFDLVAQKIVGGNLSGSVLTDQTLSVVHGDVYVVGAKFTKVGTITETYTIEAENLGETGDFTFVDADGAILTAFPGGKILTIQADGVDIGIKILAIADETEVDPPSLETEKEMFFVKTSIAEPPPIDFNTGMNWNFFIQRSPTAAQNIDLNASTTRTLPSAINSRYVIYNNEPLAKTENNTTYSATPGTASSGGTSEEDPLIPGTPGEWCHVRDATVMWLNKPFVADTRPGQFKPYGIEARVRLTKNVSSVGVEDPAHTTPKGGSNQQNVIVGFMKTPTELNKLTFEGSIYTSKITNAELTPDYVGMRIESHGRLRAALQRFETATGLTGRAVGGISPSWSAATNTTNTTLPLATGTDLNTYSGNFTQPDNYTTKVEAFFGQEFIYRMIRVEVAQWMGFVYNKEGELLWGFYNAPGSQIQHPSMGDASELYPIIMLTGVEAEISGIKLFHGLPSRADHSYYGDPDLDSVWSDPNVAGATAGTVTARKVTITPNATSKIEDNDADYAILANDFPASITLTAKILPLSMPQTVNFSVSGTGTSVVVANSQGTGIVTRSGTNTGKTTIIATPILGEPGQFVFDLVAPAGLTSITIHSDETSIIGGPAGQARTTVQLHAVPNSGATIPAGATWVVTAGGSLATVNSTTGLLTAATTVASAGKVTVTVTSGSVTSEPIEIDVRPNEDMVFYWSAEAITSFPTSNSTGANNNGTFLIGGKNAKILNGTWSQSAGTNYINLPTTGRVVIGSVLGAASLTGAAPFDPDGELDLSKKFKIVVTVVSGTGSNFRIAFNTNDNNMNAGPLGSATRLQTAPVPGDIEFVVDTSVMFTTFPLMSGTDTVAADLNALNDSLAKSFIMLGADSAATAVISAIRVERID